MMKINILFLFFVIVNTIFSQDLVVKRNGERIYCKILKDDSVKLIILTTPDGYETKTEIEKYKIRSIVYNYKTSDEISVKYNKPEPTPEEIIKKYPDENKNTAITIGFLNGGGALVGFDFEILIGKRIGIQLGGGYIAYGAGINLHFAPRINSSFLSIQYWNQGTASSFTQSLIGPSLVIRARKILAAQIGLGYVLERGPSWPAEIKTGPVILTYAVGLYFPLKAN